MIEINNNNGAGSKFSYVMMILLSNCLKIKFFVIF